TRRHFAHACAAVLAAAWAAAPALAQGPPGPPATAVAARHDVSPPLRSIPVRPPLPGQANRAIPIRTPLDLAERHRPSPAAPDPVLQSAVGAAATPSPIRNFEGLSDDDNAAVLGFRVVPPDTEGDVGASHYVQWINLIFAVYDKATGARVFGPVPGNTLWSGFGGICETNNDGDPIVLYDQAADRWVFSQFAIGADGHQCVAVSTSGDPTGSYFRYDFVVSPGFFNDYPKLGVWPDAYYLTANEFNSSYRGVIAVAFERAKMLNGQPAQMVKFGPLPCDTECYFSMQPAHWEGTTAPPAGAPNPFLQAWDDEVWGTGSGPDGYRMFEFHVDWTTPSSSTFTALPQVGAPEFDAEFCNFNRGCIPQPRPGERLDPLGQFTMYRLHYRNSGTHESLLVNHTVDVSGNSLAGVRWAELRDTGGGWFLHQTGTFAPADGLHRWMGSVNMDGQGNIALGYSVSSGNTFPSVRYVSRAAGDPLGTMPGGEVQLVAGGGSQQNSSNRWGDYSTMSVDPVDDCTFWYTQEYYANSGSFDFKTRIGSFNLCDGGGGCTPTESPEVSCSDGIDNDCDGFVDGADTDCQTSCLPVGSSCTSDSQCCSNKCRGPSGGKTCK
ncbi:MAG TPA: hypothetical protein VF121_14880, partial [Thermoanaerobaculia bacterium]|nr:hypothetical protein [Thermoanaerobaculia bacterium]